MKNLESIKVECYRCDGIFNISECETVYDVYHDEIVNKCPNCEDSNCHAVENDDCDWM